MSAFFAPFFCSSAGPSCPCVPPGTDLVPTRHSRTARERRSPGSDFPPRAVRLQACDACPRQACFHCSGTGRLVFPLRSAPGPNKGPCFFPQPCHAPSVTARGFAPRRRCSAQGGRRAAAFPHGRACRKAAAFSLNIECRMGALSFPPARDHHPPPVNVVCRTEALSFPPGAFIAFSSAFLPCAGPFLLRPPRFRLLGCGTPLSVFRSSASPDEKFCKEDGGAGEGGKVFQNFPSFPRISFPCPPLPLVFRHVRVVFLHEEFISASQAGHRPCP